MVIPITSIVVYRLADCVPLGLLREVMLSPSRSGDTGPVGDWDGPRLVAGAVKRGGVVVRELCVRGELILPFVIRRGAEDPG
jgi:hypothetical protein